MRPCRAGEPCGDSVMKLPLSRVAEFIAAAGQFDPSVTAHGYSIDSRTVQPGELFFAVKGDRFDGHDFVESALARGAVGAVADYRAFPPRLPEQPIFYPVLSRSAGASTASTGSPPATCRFSIAPWSVASR